jgi:cell division transport system ATP-binding protein
MVSVTGAPGGTIRRRVPQLLNLVGLQDHSQHLTTQLSGGEQQRVAIARALVHDPAILIADEPTGNLDPVTSWEIIQLLIQINELGTTVLMATHNQEIVNAMRRRVLALEHGTLVRDESGAAYEREY